MRAMQSDSIARHSANTALCSCTIAILATCERSRLNSVSVLRRDGLPHSAAPSRLACTSLAAQSRRAGPRRGAECKGDGRAFGR